MDEKLRKLFTDLLDYLTVYRDDSDLADELYWRVMERKHEIELGPTLMTSRMKGMKL